MPKHTQLSDEQLARISAGEGFGTTTVVRDKVRAGQASMPQRSRHGQ